MRAPVPFWLSGQAEIGADWNSKTSDVTAVDLNAKRSRVIRFVSHTVSIGTLPLTDKFAPLPFHSVLANFDVDV